MLVMMMMLLLKGTGAPLGKGKETNEKESKNFVDSLGSLTTSVKLARGGRDHR